MRDIHAVVRLADRAGAPDLRPFRVLVKPNAAIAANTRDVNPLVFFRLFLIAHVSPSINCFDWRDGDGPVKAPPPPLSM